MVECLTDNVNRAASDMRILFRKGQLRTTKAASQSQKVNQQPSTGCNEQTKKQKGAEIKRHRHWTFIENTRRCGRAWGNGLVGQPLTTSR